MQDVANRGERPVHTGLVQDEPVRYHALDALRASMMLLGLVLHVACNYVTFPLSSIWPYKDCYTSQFADLIVVYIHSFRMPVFMAGGLERSPSCF